MWPELAWQAQGMVESHMARAVSARVREIPPEWIMWVLVT